MSTAAEDPSEGIETKEAAPGKIPGVERILTAAARLIVVKGLETVTLKDIAEQAGLSTTFVHANFGAKEGPAVTKNNIVNAIYLRFIQHVHELIQLSIKYQQRDAPHVDQLVAVLRATLDAFKDSPEFGKLVLKYVWADLSRKSQQLEPLFSIFGIIDDILEGARQEGELATASNHLSVPMIRHMLFGAVHMLLMSHYVSSPPTPQVSQEIVEVECLRILRIHCADTAGERIDKLVGLLKEQLSQIAT